MDKTVYRGLEGYQNNDCYEIVALFYKHAGRKRTSHYWGIFKRFDKGKEQQAGLPTCYCVAHDSDGVYFTTLPECYAYLQGRAVSLHGKIISD